MKLDKRIKEGKKPLDCFDAENKELMKSFLNKEGYVSNNIANYCFLNKCPKRFLSNVFKEVRDCFTTHINGGNGGDWKYFLPAEWVKPEEPEKKYREYKDLDEFFDVTGLEIGDLIKLKFPGNNIAELLIVGGCYNGLFIGIHKYTFKQLFEMVEISISGEWQPFGVIDEQGVGE